MPLRNLVKALLRPTDIVLLPFPAALRFNDSSSSCAELATVATSQYLGPPINVTLPFQCTFHTENYLLVEVGQLLAGEVISEEGASLETLA